MYLFRHVNEGVENYYILTFCMLDYILLNYILKILIQKFSTFSGLPEKKCNVCIKSFWKKVIAIPNILRCTDLQNKNYEVLRSTIALEKVNLDCSETVKSKPTRNDSGFIISSNTINFDSKWLYNSGYLLNQCKKR